MTIKNLSGIIEWEESQALSQLGPLAGRREAQRTWCVWEADPRSTSEGMGDAGKKEPQRVLSRLPLREGLVMPCSEKRVGRLQACPWETRRAPREDFRAGSLRSTADRGSRADSGLRFEDLLLKRG